MQLEAPSTLPQPDADSALHSERCADFIRARIAAAGGRIRFAEFMQHALYAPGLGYYAAGSAKFGAAGDFVTAPEVSSLFGHVLARQCAEVFGEVAGAAILELGAGSGRLAVDLLTRLEQLDALPERYLILEVSADLKERQEQRLRRDLPKLFERVVWVDALPESHQGVIIANEVLDALPVERFVKRATPQLLHVANGDAGFEFVEADAPADVLRQIAKLEEELGEALADGYTSELSLATPGWVADVLRSLGNGVAFLFDYGLSRREYYAPDRGDGWLRCHFRHHAHNDPLLLPGIQDITAWVDFTAVAEAAVDAEADIAGYVSQAQFLLNGGLDQELADLQDLAEQQRAELSAQVKLLTLPGEMGERFKCLGLSRGPVSSPSAFSTADRTHTL